MGVCDVNVPTSLPLQWLPAWLQEGPHNNIGQSDPLFQYPFILDRFTFVAAHWGGKSDLAAPAGGIYKYVSEC